MTAVTKIRALPYAPAIIYGFASLVGPIVATNRLVITYDFANPILVTRCGILVGALLGFVSELGTRVLSIRTITA